MQKTPFKNLSNWQLRVISAIFIGFVFITIIFLIRFLFLILISGIASGMLIEWYDMSNKKKFYLYLGLLLIPIPISCLFYISINDKTGWLLFLFFATIWSIDSIAMFVGRIIKGPKLAPKISPKKTISGFLGGIAVASIIPILLDLILLTNVINYKLTSYHFAFFAVIAQMSDLLLSFFKRKFNIKNSGNIIPGHGGLLDRFDSIILTAPMAAFYLHSQLELSAI